MGRTKKRSSRQVSTKRTRRKKTKAGRAKVPRPVSIGTSYPAYKDLREALYQARYKRREDTVVLKSVFYLVLPVDVWASNMEHYGTCELIEIIEGGNKCQQ